MPGFELPVNGTIQETLSCTELLELIGVGRLTRVAVGGGGLSPSAAVSRAAATTSLPILLSTHIWVVPPTPTHLFLAIMSQTATN